MLLKVIALKNVWSGTIHFLIIKFQNSICNGSHDLAMLSLNVSDITLIAVKGVDYHCTIHGISKSEGIRLWENSVLDDYMYM